LAGRSTPFIRLQLCYLRDGALKVGKELTLEIEVPALLMALMI
jgi:hypothetical protein